LQLILLLLFVAAVVVYYVLCSQVMAAGVLWAGACVNMHMFWRGHVHKTGPPSALTQAFICSFVYLC